MSLTVHIQVDGQISTHKISLISTHKIEIASDGEHVYALILGSAAKNRNIQPDVYHVWMLDLREFSLPCGIHLYAANCEGESCKRCLLKT